MKISDVQGRGTALPFLFLCEWCIVGNHFCMRRSFLTTNSLDLLEKLKNGNFTFFSQERVKNISFRRWLNLLFRVFMEIWIEAPKWAIFLYFVWLYRLSEKASFATCWNVVIFFSCCCCFFLPQKIEQNPPSRSSSCRRGSAPGSRDHGSFQPYPWQVQAWIYFSLMTLPYIANQL